MKLNTAIEIARKELKRNEIKSPSLDSELLLTEVIKQNREFIILNSKNKICEEDYSHFQKLISERMKGRPVAHLTGKKFFWKHEFIVNNKVLIPRPDTEIIVEQVLNLYKNKSKINFLDIGFGSGCILLSILKEKKDFKAIGVDVSKHALKICNINAYNLGVKSRVKLFKSDIDKFSMGKYDLIISNPPYIKKHDIKYLEKDVNCFEPKLALDGGLEGTLKIKKVIRKASSLLKKNGKLILEIGHSQKNIVTKLLKNKGFYINKTVKDYAQHNRCIISTKI